MRRYSSMGPALLCVAAVGGFACIDRNYDPNQEDEAEVAAEVGAVELAATVATPPPAAAVEAPVVAACHAVVAAAQAKNLTELLRLVTPESGPALSKAGPARDGLVKRLGAASCEAPQLQDNKAAVGLRLADGALQSVTFVKQGEAWRMDWVAYGRAYAASGQGAGRVQQPGKGMQEGANKGGRKRARRQEME